MDNELTHHCGSLIGQTTMPKNKSSEIRKLRYTKVGSETCLLTLFTDYSYSNICFKDHADIVSTISDSCSSFTSVLINLFDYQSFLSRAASAHAHTRSLSGSQEEFLLH